MSKLLRANFMRLGKSYSFLLSVIIQVFWAVIVFIMAYSMHSEKNLVFGRSIVVGSYIMFFLSIFITSFICDDYSCRTIRNKLIVGHSRGEIYFSNLITMWIGSIIMLAAYWVIIAVFSAFLGLETGMLPSELCFVIVTQIAAVTALVSLYVMLSELVTSKSGAVTAALILSLLSAVIVSMNMESGMPEAVSSGGISVFFNDIMPSGQLVQMERVERTANIPHIFPLYSLAVTVVSSAVGVLIFRRKGLK